MSAINDLSAAELTRAYGDGALSPLDVARHMLAEIDRWQPVVNAFSFRDDASVLAAGEASEKRWRSGTAKGPLDGVPVTVKDNINVRGWPNRRGSAAVVPEAGVDDAPATERLREAGAIILGKTTMPDFGWKGTSDSPATGLTRNPWDTRMTTGGSSSGAAACAALGIGRIHIGTDGAGSVRIPAAFTGVVGFKPTFGRVPAYPVSTMGVLAHLGPLTQTVAEAALAMNVIGLPDTRDMLAVLADGQDYTGSRAGGVKGLRIAYSPTLGFAGEVDPDVAALTRKATETLAALGAHVEEAEPGFADPIAPLMLLWETGAAIIVRSIAEDRRHLLDPGLAALARAGERHTASDFANALYYQRNALSLAMARFHERYDLLVTPTMPLPAFEAGRLVPQHGRYGDVWTNWSPFTYPFNLTQQPAISVPSGLTRAGLPVGLQIVGRFGADREVLQAAATFEAASPRLRLPQLV